MKGRKKIVINAGTNCAGKTTFAREFLPREAGCPDFINVDLIAAGLSPFDPDRVAPRAGYHVKLIFLRLPTADLAVRRVSARVAQGGHDVSEDVIRRRFDAGLRNFQNLYQRLVNTWIIYDNSGPAPIPTATGGNR